MADIVISAPVFDPYGFVPLGDIDRKASDFRGVSRRATRVPTLDGGAVINDSGYSAADRTISLALSALASLELLENLKRIVQTYSSVYLTLPDGVYLACPSNYRVSNGKASITLLITAALWEF